MTRRKRLADFALRVITLGWLCFQCGSVLQSHTQWGRSELFWPTWIMLILLVACAIMLYDVFSEYFNEKKPKR
jgi:hypothetical protein